MTWSFFNRNQLADDMSVPSWLTEPPVQTPTAKTRQTASVGDQDYEIIPRYDYEITGLVVSYRVHNSEYGVHKMARDHLNVADVCIIWGENATTLPLTKFKFWNLVLTCNIKTKKRKYWQQFNWDELSNNHLISDDPLVRNSIRKIRPGDQVTIKGWLADYRNLDLNGGFRETSTVRTDMGNGACETLLVDEIDIVSTYTSIWKILMIPFALLFFGSCAWYVSRPIRLAD